MTELRVSHLIDEADELLDNKFHVGSYCLFMNTDDIQDILSKIRAILPEEIKTAEMILKRRDDIYMEAQSRADRIISEAQNTAANILSESELIRAVREKAAKIQEQVKESCEDMKDMFLLPCQPDLLFYKVLPFFSKHLFLFLNQALYYIFLSKY